MIKQLLLVVALLFPLLAAAQFSDSLTADFKQDFMGSRGLRDKHIQTPDVLYTQDPSPGLMNSVLFDGQSLIGKTKKEVLALLGQPNNIDDFLIFLRAGNNKAIKRNSTLEYYIDSCDNVLFYSVDIILRNNVVRGTCLRMYCG